MPRSTRLHYAWIVFGVTFLVMLTGAGIRAAPGALMMPLEMEFGWSPAALGGVIALSILLYGLVGPFAAAIYERFGGIDGSAYFIGGFPAVGARYGVPDIGLKGFGEISACVRESSSSRAVSCRRYSSGAIRSFWNFRPSILFSISSFFASRAFLAGSVTGIAASP